MTSVLELLESYPQSRSDTVSRVKLLSSFFKNFTVEELRPREVAKYRDLRLHQVSAGAVLRELSILAKVITRAMKDGVVDIPYNPVSRIEKPRDNLPRERRPEEHELTAVLLSLKPDQRILVKLAIETACRRSELVLLNWDQVDLDTRVIRLEHTKNGYRRTVPLSRPAVELLRSLPRTTSRVFGNMTPGSMSQAFRRACAKAGVKDLKLHDMRHEATSRLMEMGLDIRETAAMTGHRDLRMLMRYTHPKPQSILDKLDRNC